MIRLQRSNPDGTAVLTLPFRSMEDALAFKRKNEFGPETRIESLRHADDPERQTDLVKLIGERLRDSLKKAWWSEQMERLAAGEIRMLPKNLAHGFAAETAVFGELTLMMAGATGWSAKEGVYHEPAIGPMVPRTATSAPVPHAWLYHETGVILDITGLVLDRSPVAVLTASDDRFSSFIETSACEAGTGPLSRAIDSEGFGGAIRDLRELLLDLDLRQGSDALLPSPT